MPRCEPNITLRLTGNNSQVKSNFDHIFCTFSNTYGLMVKVPTYGKQSFMQIFKAKVGAVRETVTSEAKFKSQTAR